MRTLMAKSVKKSSDSERYIPSEIFFMVFLMLPTKLLVQLRSVCKQWRDIISDNCFIKAHLDRANGINKLSLIRSYIYDGPWMKSFYLEDRSMRYEFSIPMKAFSPLVEILASCNGLLLLGDDIRCYYLWNPSTRLLKQFNGLSVYRDELRNFALGYDATTKAYKVVRIVRFTGGRLWGSRKGLRYRRFDDSVYDSTTASIYNCKTEIWDKIEHFPYFLFENAQGVTVNGSPHWVMYKDHSANDEDIDLVIVCFDFVEDRFKEILKPDWLEYSCIFCFGVLEGQLCFVRDINKLKREVWVMQVYGESWIDVSSLVNIANLPGWCGDRPLGHFGSMAFDRALYVECLVSPYGGDDNSDMIG